GAGACRPHAGAGAGSRTGRRARAGGPAGRRAWRTGFGAAAGAPFLLPLAAAAEALRPAAAHRAGLHADAVLDMAHAAARVRQVLGAVLHPALLDVAFQGHRAVADADLDVAGVDVRILGQALAQVLVDAGIGAGVVARAHAPVASPRRTVLPAAVAARAGLAAAGLGVGRVDEARSVPRTGGIAVLLRAAVAGAAAIAGPAPVVALPGVAAAAPAFALAEAVVAVVAGVPACRTAVGAVLGMQALPAVRLGPAVVLGRVVVGAVAGLALLVGPGLLPLAPAGVRTALPALMVVFPAGPLVHVVPPVIKPVAPGLHGTRTQREHVLGDCLEFVSNVVVLVSHGCLRSVIVAPRRGGTRVPG